MGNKYMVIEVKGGSGSGNWGHRGVPGQRGGSAGGAGGGNSYKDYKFSFHGKPYGLSKVQQAFESGKFMKTTDKVKHLLVTDHSKGVSHGSVISPNKGLFKGVPFTVRDFGRVSSNSLASGVRPDPKAPLAGMQVSSFIGAFLSPTGSSTGVEVELPASLFK